MVTRAHWAPSSLDTRRHRQMKRQKNCMYFSQMFSHHRNGLPPAKHSTCTINGGAAQVHLAPSSTGLRVTKTGTHPPHDFGQCTREMTPAPTHPTRTRERLLAQGPHIHGGLRAARTSPLLSRQSEHIRHPKTTTTSSQWSYNRPQRKREHPEHRKYHTRSSLPFVSSSSRHSSSPKCQVVP